MNTDQLTTLRRELHTTSELSGAERETSQHITRELEARGATDIHTNLGGHGLAARYGNKQPVLVRCELDALPIPETIDLPHASTATGIAHKCGHDGHMAIALGVAELAHESGSDIALLFQPAEETGAGARAVLDSGFDIWRPRKAIALHNLPGYPLGSIIVREGTFACASVGLRMTFHGITTHAATPELGRSPVPAITRLCARINEYERPTDRVELATITSLRAGDADFGIAPGDATLCVTARAETDDVLRALTDRIETIAKEEAEQDALELAVAHHERFPALINDAEVVQTIRDAATALGYPVVELDQPNAFAEDFAHLVNAFGGAMFGLGAGEHCPPLHDVRYDFPDDLIEPGARTLYEVAKRLNQPSARGG